MGLDVSLNAYIFKFVRNAKKIPIPLKFIFIRITLKDNETYHQFTVKDGFFMLNSEFIKKPRRFLCDNDYS